MGQKGWYHVEDGVGIYRASSFGSCIRSLTAARLGEPETPPGKSLQAAMDASSALEDSAYEGLSILTGGTVIWQQKTVELDIPSHDVIIRGHIDGLWQEEDDIIEVKWLSQRNFDLYNSRGLDGLGNLGVKYFWQGAIYGHATSRNIRFVIGNKNALPDASWADRLIIAPAVDPSTLVSIEQIRARISDIERYAADDEYPDCVQGCTEWDSYGHIHIFDSPTQGSDELKDLLDLHYELKMQIDELTMQKDAIAESIKQSYAEGKYTAGPYTMNLYRVNPTRFDKKAAEKVYPGIIEICTVPGTSYVGMKVSGIPEGGEEIATG